MNEEQNILWSGTMNTYTQFIITKNSKKKNSKILKSMI